jgi:glycosyltransferase involved in cell wall biosynthesis
MKLFVIIPAYNEAKTISKVIQSIPKKIKGIKTIRTLVWSDGSSDQTVAIAKQAGADFIFESKRNLGLAKTFNLASKKAVELGADIVVNTDGDNQYDQQEIPLLLEPILQGQADIVNGDRQVNKLEHMPWPKKYGNQLGSFVIRLLTGLKLNDASSGFRAYTKEAIESFNILSSHTYTHETIIQAVFKDLTIAEVPVTFKKRTTGGSRLISNVWSHIKKSGATIIRTILMYKAFKYLLTLGLIIMAIGMCGVLRFLYFVFQGNGGGHIQSLIIASIFISIGFNTILMGVVADLISINRKTFKRT